MSIIDQAKSELKRINFGAEDTAVMVGLLEKFLDQWDSGGAVCVVAPVFVRLLSGQPLSPLTGDVTEWFDPMGDGIMLQNARCSTVFKTWRENGEIAARAGLGKLVINDIENPAWDGKFPYDPTTRLPSIPEVTIGGSPLLKLPRQINITATVFGGTRDQEESAYGGMVSPVVLGVALPFKFEGKRPLVRVFNSATGVAADAQIVDVGPWNGRTPGTSDPYWERNARPQAESGIDHIGRKTNQAGIDLTPALAKALRVNGKGLVNWEFVDAPDEVA